MAGSTEVGTRAADSEGAGETGAWTDGNEGTGVWTAGAGGGVTWTGGGAGRAGGAGSVTPAWVGALSTPSTVPSDVATIAKRVLVVP